MGLNASKITTTAAAVAVATTHIQLIERKINEVAHHRKHTSDS